MQKFQIDFLFVHLNKPDEDVLITMHFEQPFVFPLLINYSLSNHRVSYLNNSIKIPIISFRIFHPNQQSLVIVRHAYQE